MEISFREIRETELEALLELYRHLHRSDVPLPEAARVEQVWNDILHNPAVHCLVAEHDGQLVGSCMLMVLPNLTRGTRSYAFIENVVVHSGYQRQGIGTRMLQYALKIAGQENSYKAMLLTCRDDVHGFYEKAGFVKGTKTGFVALLRGPAEQPEDASGQ